MASREFVPLSSTNPPRPVSHSSQPGADSPSAAREDRTQSHPDALISHLFHLCDPSVQQAFEPSHLTREWLDSLPVPPGCSRRPEPSSNEQWALVEQWRIAAGTIRYYAQFATDSWYQHQYWQQQQQQQQQAAANSLHNPPWGSAFENDVRAEQYRLFGSAPLTERVAAAAAADAAFLGAFSHPNGQQHAAAEWLSSTGHGREELDEDDEGEGDEDEDEIEDDDDDEDYEDEEEEDNGREFSFPIDLAALAKSAGMPFPASGSGSGSVQKGGGGGGGASTYEDIVNRLAQAQQQVQQSGGDRGFTPAQLLQLQSAGAMIASEGGGGGDMGPNGDGHLVAAASANGILSDSTDPLSLGPASLPSLMAAISELEQCVARLSLEASEARSLQRRMRDELGAPPTAAGADLAAYGEEGGEGAEGEERLRAALEKKKMRNKKKKDKKKAKAAAAAVAAAAEAEAAHSQSQQQEQQLAASLTRDDGAESASSEENGGDVGAAAAADVVDHPDHSLSAAAHGQAPRAGDEQNPPSQASPHKKEDGELIKALQSVSMLDRRADEYRERLRVLKEQIHHHAALADALAASSSSPPSSLAIPAHAAAHSQPGYHPDQHRQQNGAGASSGPTLGSLNAAAVASATVPLYYDGAQGQEGQIGEYDDDEEEEEDEEDEGDLYEEEEEEEEEEVMEGSPAS